MTLEFSPDIEDEMEHTIQIYHENRDIVDTFGWFDNREPDFEDIMLPENRYELGASESLTFLYNLLYDEESILSKADILRILTALKAREDRSKFAVEAKDDCDVQGIQWPELLREKFIMDRDRVGLNSWFYSVEDLRHKIKEVSSIHGIRQGILTQSINVTAYGSATDFFEFHRFYSKLKLNVTHFQLRNLLCGSRNIRTGVFYPLVYYHDHNLDPVSEPDPDDNNCFFKVNRLMYDNMLTEKAGSMKLDCIIDSKNLNHNSYSRISTIACSDSLLACGTFEGNYILSDISKHNEPRTIGEYSITKSSNGIINNLIVLDDGHLLLALNDSSVVFVDTNTQSKSKIASPFPINCMTENPFQPNELLATGDCVDSLVIDKRSGLFHKDNISLKGHMDFGFGCDWSPSDENMLLTGNQDCCVKVWDKRNTKQSVYTWLSALGSSSTHGGPVRNVKFSHHGEYISWAESLDHVGILPVSDLTGPSGNTHLRVQNIDFIGKCTGLAFAPADDDSEILNIGISDCPLGGIMTHKLHGKSKMLDFDFQF